MINIKKELTIMAVLTPIIYMLIAVSSFPLPMQKFACWSWATLLAELLIYGAYIFTLKIMEVEK